MDRSAGDLQLIRFVRQYQYLYDTGSDNYKNVKLKDNTWKKIALALGLSVEVSKTRWKSLRTSYLRHCKLMACRKKESTKCRKWPLADELSFLNPYLVPTDYVAGTNGSAGGGEEPEPLSEDAWARVYEEAKPQPMEAVSVRLEVEEDEEDDATAAAAVAATAVTEVVEDDEEEDEDDDIEEIMEHHPPEEELREVFRPESNEARADSAGSDGSYSSMITLVEPDSVSRSERRPRGSGGAASSAALTNGVGGGGDGGRSGGGGGGAGGGGGISKRNAHSVVVLEEENRRQRDTTRDFFLYLADTVKTFPPYLQAQVKGKCFDAVNSAELSYMSRMGNSTSRR